MSDRPVCPNGCEKPVLNPKDKNKPLVVEGVPVMEPAALILVTSTRIASELDCCAQCSVCGYTKNWVQTLDGKLFDQGEEVAGIVFEVSE